MYKNHPAYGVLPGFDEAAAAGAFAKLIGDGEAEVRCVACQRAVRVGNRLQLGTLAQYVLPQLDERACVDDSQFVKLTLARHVSYLAELLPRDSVQKQLLPTIFKLLEDKDPEVRVTLLNNLKHII